METEVPSMLPSKNRILALTVLFSLACLLILFLSPIWSAKPVFSGMEMALTLSDDSVCFSRPITDRLVVPVV